MSCKVWSHVRSCPVLKCAAALSSAEGRLTASRKVPLTLEIDVPGGAEFIHWCVFAFLFSFPLLISTKGRYRELDTVGLISV